MNFPLRNARGPQSRWYVALSFFSILVLTDPVEKRDLLASVFALDATLPDSNQQLAYVKR